MYRIETRIDMSLTTSLLDLVWRRKRP